jgi:hypothetical protein
MAPIATTSQTWTTAQTSNPSALAPPTGTQSGDIIIALLSLTGGTGVTTLPTASATNITWTRDSHNDSTTSKCNTILVGVVSGTPGATTFSWSPSQTGGAVVMATYRGLDTTTQPDVASTTAVDNNSPYNPPAITTVTDGDTILSGIATVTSATFTYTTGQVEEIAVSTGSSVSLADETQTTHGTASAANATGSSNKAGTVHRVALRVAAAAAATSLPPPRQSQQHMIMR